MQDYYFKKALNDLSAQLESDINEL